MSQLSNKVSKKLETSRNQILKFIKDRNYKLITDINQIQKETDDFAYICCCGEKKERSLFNIKCNKDELSNLEVISSCCIKKGNVKKWYQDENLNEYIDDTNTKWIKFQKLFWVSQNGIIIGKKGEPLSTLNNEFKTSRKTYKLQDLLLKVFYPEKYEKMESEKRIAYFINDIIHVDNIMFRENDVMINEEKNIIADIDSLKNIEKKELEEFNNFIFYKNGVVIKKPNGKKRNYVYPKTVLYNNTSAIRVSGGGNYRIDRIILLCFCPYDENLKYKDYKDIIIRHKDGNIYNNSLENLEWYSNNIVIQNKINNCIIEEKTRIQKLHEKITKFMNDRSATLITDLSKIKTVRDEFEYKCACDTIFKNRSAKHLMECGTECKECKHKRLHTANQDQTLDFEKDGVKYKKFNLGWASETGKILNNNKQELVQVKGYVKIGNNSYYVKNIIVDTFDIKYKEYLSVNSFFLKTIDGTENYALDNIYVWSSHKSGQQNLTDNYHLNEKHKQIVAKPKNDIYIKLKKDEIPKNGKEFLGYTFYDTGLIKIAPEIFTYGYPTKYIYRSINIKGNPYKVHRLICFLFNPIEGKNKFEDYPQNLFVNHKDGNKENNNALNLEWISAKENTRHAIENDLCRNTIPVNLFKIDKNGEKIFVKRFATISYAHKETGFAKPYIKKLINNKTNPYNEYTFERAARLVGPSGPRKEKTLSNEPTLQFDESEDDEKE